MCRESVCREALRSGLLGLFSVFVVGFSELRFSLFLLLGGV